MVDVATTGIVCTLIDCDGKVVATGNSLQGSDPDVKTSASDILLKSIARTHMMLNFIENRTPAIIREHIDEYLRNKILLTLVSRKGYRLEYTTVDYAIRENNRSKNG